MLALISAIDHFRDQFNNKFIVYTDHKALTWLKTIKHTIARLIRWALKLQEYTFDIKHRPGIKHQNCDALSRRPYPDQNISQNKNAFSQDDDLLPSEKTEITFIYANENYEEILKMTEHVTENEKVTINVLSDQPHIKVEQQNCPYFKHIYEYIQQGVLPADKNRARAIPYEANQYEIINDVLYHIFEPRTKNKEKTEVILKQLAVPEKLRNDVIKSYHYSIAGGCHLGVQRTYVAIKQKYFWPKMYKLCIPCQSKVPLIDGIWIFWQGYQKQNKAINIFYWLQIPCHIGQRHCQ